MAEEIHELGSDDLDGIAGGGRKIEVPLETQAGRLIRELKSKGLTKEEALELYRGDDHFKERNIIKSYWR